jgi:hypothetical protein
VNAYKFAYEPNVWIDATTPGTAPGCPDASRSSRLSVS